MNNLKTYKAVINTPIGNLTVTTCDEFLLSIDFKQQPVPPYTNSPAILKITLHQLNEYFIGKRKEFSIPFRPEGSDFQKEVWEKVSQIKFGQTETYGLIAEKLGSSLKTRAVGMANSKNPIPIIIPCHRIIGKNGKLTGYAGGLQRKLWLLQHEQKYSQHLHLLF